MKMILTSLNTKYIHTSLSIRTLQSNAMPAGTQSTTREYTINEPLDHIVSDLYSHQADIYGFSCYIWNIEETLKIVETLKKILPNTLIILGGPEVSYDSMEILKGSSADIIVRGEGEITLLKLLEKIERGEDYREVEGISYKVDHAIGETKERMPVQNMDQLTFPYEKEDMSKFKNQILYYEGSRGCPFSCSYCLSAQDKTVRLCSVQRVQKDLQFFLDHNVKQVKFVDRTFNCNAQWAKAIISYLIDHHNGHTNFHFEMAADLLDDELIALLNSAPVGLFQLEIGVQSVNEATLKAIQRSTCISKIGQAIQKLSINHNMHIHLDVIAGLPKENFSSFSHSFDRVYAMKPDMLQLGFLKVLKGSPIHQEADKYHLQYTSYPPYEILSNDCLSYKEIAYLKKIETLVDRYNNSGLFQNTLTYLIEKKGRSPFAFFDEFVRYCEDEDLLGQSHSKDKAYDILMTFAVSIDNNKAFIQELIKLDYLLFNKLNLPSFLPDSSPRKEDVFEMLKDVKFKSQYLPNQIEMAVKDLYKKVQIQVFTYDVTHLDTPVKKSTTLLFQKANPKKLRQENSYIVIEE